MQGPLSLGYTCMLVLPQLSRGGSCGPWCLEQLAVQHLCELEPQQGAEQQWQWSVQLQPGYGGKQGRESRGRSGGAEYVLCYTCEMQLKMSLGRKGQALDMG